MVIKLVYDDRIHLISDDSLSFIITAIDISIAVFIIKHWQIANVKLYYFEF